MTSRLLVRDARLVTPEIGVMEGHLVAEDGKIAGLLPARSPVPEADTVVDAQGRYVLPGAIDAHSHYGLLPPIEERIPPESAFAALGGVTTLVRYFRRTDSYLKTVPDHLRLNPALHYQDFALHLALFSEQQVQEIPSCIEELGVTSFKIYTNLKAPVARSFLIDPLVGDTTMQTADLDYDDGLLFAAMELMSKVRAQVRLSVHVEEADLIIRQTARVRALGFGGPLAWHYARPQEAEALGIQKVAYLSRRTGVPIFFPHIGSRLGVMALREELLRGTPMVAETCPHYLVLNTDSPAGSLLKVMPPVRTHDDNSATWEAVQDKVITVVGTDHIPWTSQEKGSGDDIWSLRPAFGSTGLMVPLMFSEGVATRRISIVEMAGLTSQNAAKAFGLYPLKGTLLPGADADLMVIDPEAKWTVRASELKSKQDFSVYDGMHLTGKVAQTIVRGKVVCEDGRVVGDIGHGRYIRRFPHLQADS